MAILHDLKYPHILELSFLQYYATSWHRVGISILIDEHKVYTIAALQYAEL